MMRLQVFLVAGLVLVGAAVAFLFIFDSRDGKNDGSSDDAGRGTHLIDGNGPDRDRVIDNDRPDPDQTGTGNGMHREIVPGKPFIEGDVRDRTTGAPVERCRLTLYREEGAGRSAFVLERLISGKNGHFRIPLAKGGEYRLLFATSEYRLLEKKGLQVPRDGGLTGLVFELDRGAVVSGRVVADATGMPVSGALVVWASRLESDLETLLLGRPESCLHATTDEKGRFTLSGLQGKRIIVAALHPDYAATAGKAAAGERELEIRLGTGFRVFGIVFDNSGQPCPGVVVTLSGMGMPHPVPVLTGPDGSYRSHPAPPGQVTVSARLPSSQEAAKRFSQETKSTEIVDRDVEVLFGPEPGQVTWRGVLHDMSGEPVPDGRVSLFLYRAGTASSPPLRIQRSVTTDEAGRFEILKLIPDRFRVDLEFPSPRSTMRWGEIEFEAPGLTERDIRVEGAGIEGIVIDGGTGEPFSKGGCSVRVRESSGRSSSSRADVGKDGRFCLRGLAPGNYNLIAGGPGLVETTLLGIDLEEGQVESGVRLEIPQGGRLDLVLGGFESRAQQQYEVTVVREGKVKPVFKRFHVVEPGGDNTVSLLLEPGLFSVTVSFESLGMVDRRFEIHSGSTSVVRMTPDDFFLFQGTVSLIGKVSRKDGRVLDKAYMEFTCRNLPGADSDQRLKGKTDPEGNFYIEGFRPGRWKVTALLIPDRSRVFLPDLVLPESPTDPLTHDFEIAAGMVSGMIRDSATGLLFDDKSARWRVRLIDADTTAIVAELDGERTGSSFNMEGIPAGRYRMDFQAIAYEHHLSDVFELREAETRDLGEISLRPAAVITLSVEDRDGMSIERPRVSFPRMSGARRPLPLGGGRKGQYYLPTPGSIRIRISAEGFKTRETTVVIEAGQEETIRVVLERKQPGR